MVDTLTEREVFVVFRPVARPRWWWHRVIDPARAHVLAIWREKGVTLALNHTGTVLAVEVVGLAPEDAARGLCLAWDAEALRLTVRVPEHGQPCLRPVMTCVEAVKALLGMTSWRIWTPRQLRRALIRRGARAVPIYRSGEVTERRVTWASAVAAR